MLGSGAPARRLTGRKIFIEPFPALGSGDVQAHVPGVRHRGEEKNGT
jgi:hypothetical protein